MSNTVSIADTVEADETASRPTSIKNFIQKKELNFSNEKKRSVGISH